MSKKCAGKDCSNVVHDEDLCCEPCIDELERLLRQGMADRMGRPPTDAEFEEALAEFMTRRPS